MLEPIDRQAALAEIDATIEGSLQRPEDVYIDKGLMMARTIIEKLPAIQTEQHHKNDVIGMDKAKIMRLLDEADDIVSALYRQGANKDYKCKSLREKLQAIAAEISEKPKSNADHIRQMTDDELAKWVIKIAGCNVCVLFRGGKCEARSRSDCDNVAYEWLQKEEEINDER